MRFLEDRVARDPDDFVALNKLAGYYLQSYRETYDNSYLTLAERSAEASLRVLGPEQNPNGLFALAQARFTLHDFAGAQAYGRQLVELQADKSYGYQMLGDALLELGDYDQAAAAYQQMADLDSGSMATESRLARLAFLRGEPEVAYQAYARALAAELNARVPSSETVAWCHWQLGETEFQVGKYRQAEQHYRDALKAFPDYVRALGSLGKVRAALKDYKGAIEQYERAIRVVPEPAFLTALGDLYQLTGRTNDAENQYSLAEKIGKLNQVNGALYGRQLSLFYADHNLNAIKAAENASRDYSARRDIYGADAFAWTSFKAGKISDAQTAIKEALKLGTKDARLLYHAGMIERAAGNRAVASDYLQRALKLSPEFDPLQATIAREALAR
ncbi:MAG TPA: tetratricopeptide repeat protein [Pyrinomonadaceae bacterium]|nr:tetratricopeptide repeat protein [Pyrinomonadaceae bacterium]